MKRKQSSTNDPRAEVTELAKAGYQLTTKQAAIYTGLTERTLETYRDIGKQPHYVKLGHHIRYPVQLLDEFLRASTMHCAPPLPLVLHDTHKMR